MAPRRAPDRLSLKRPGRLARFVEKAREPVARGVVLLVPSDAKGALAELAKEAASVLRALDAPRDAPTVADADYVLVLLDADAGATDAARSLDVPDLRDRAASATDN